MKMQTRQEQLNHLLVCACSSRSTYPQGQVSIVPQLLTLMAAVASLLPWSWFGYSVNFLCIAYTVNGSSNSECSPLLLNQELYWSSSSTQGWAAAIQAAAVFAIFGTVLGFVAFSLLVTATCFELSTRKILTIVIMQGVAALLSILTLIAGAADVCKASGYSSSCSRDGVHVETGAGFEIFAFLLYLAALGVTLFWYFQLRREATPKEESRSLVEVAPRPMPVTTVSTPNGGQRVERDYIDETGQVIHEVTFTHSEQPHHSDWHRPRHPQPAQQDSF
jgi:uncharacterized MnhB-related membrane protein